MDLKNVNTQNFGKDEKYPALENKTKQKKKETIYFIKELERRQLNMPMYNTQLVKAFEDNDNKGDFKTFNRVETILGNFTT